MNLALLIMIIGAVVFLVCKIAGRYEEIAELGRLSFFAGLLACLLK